MPTTPDVAELDSYVQLRRRRSEVPVAEDVAEFLRAYIKREQLCDGDELPSEGALSQQIGVSQRSVRDALRILASQGLIVTHQGKRATVQEQQPLQVINYFQRELDDRTDAVDDLMVLRLVLESKAAALAAVKATGDEIAGIRSVLNDLLAAADDEPPRVDLDLELHNRIAAASHNPFIRDISIALADVLADERARGVRIVSERDHTHEHSDRLHIQLVEAIEAHDATLAAAYAEEVVESARGHFREASREEADDRRPAAG